MVRQGDYIPAVMVGQIPGGPMMSGAAASAAMSASATNGGDGGTATAPMDLEEVGAATSGGEAGNAGAPDDEATLL